MNFSEDNPSQTDGLIFPSASQPIAKTFASISKRNLSISNRLRSISDDAAWVTGVSSCLCSVAGDPLPLIPNERTGSWYVPPHLKSGSAYFKSTDGHYGEWRFSLRRLNLQVLRLVGEMGGGVVVDATRRGKHLPDALSKTIPIWCAVFNRLLFPSRLSSHNLVRLPEMMSDSEAAQVSARLPQLARDAASLDLDLESLKARLKKPLRPLWIERSLKLGPPSLDEQRRFCVEWTPLYLVMASLHHDSSSQDVGYVQGAGDDGEHWSGGLTADLYWEWKEELLMTGEDELPDLISRVVSKRGASGGDGGWTAVQNAPWLEIGVAQAVGAGCVNEETVVIRLDVGAPEVLSEEDSKKVHCFPCGEGKVGSKDLRKLLPKIMAVLEGAGSDAMRVRICCKTGKDLSVGIALAVLCLQTNKDGIRTEPAGRSAAVDKLTVRRKLSWITAASPSANPSRATLNAVNEFLMGPRRPP